MLKRIGAWLLLVLFVLLIVNIIFIGWQTIISAAIYIIVFFAYTFFVLRKNTSATVKRNEEMEELYNKNSDETLSDEKDDK